MTGNSDTLNTLPFGQSVQQRGDTCCIEMPSGPLTLSKENGGYWRVTSSENNDIEVVQAFVVLLEHRTDIRCIDLGEFVFPSLKVNKQLFLIFKSKKVLPFLLPLPVAKRLSVCKIQYTVYSILC